MRLTFHCSKRWQRGIAHAAQAVHDRDIKLEPAGKQSSEADWQIEPERHRADFKGQSRGKVSEYFSNDKAFVERWLEYKWKDDDLLQHALYQKIPTSRDGRHLNLVSNQQQLALIGDRVIEACYYIHNYPLPTDRSLSGPFASLKTNNCLATIAYRAGLVHQLKRNGHSYNTGGPSSDSTHRTATLAEAILGSVYMDSGNDMDVFKRVLSIFYSRDEAEKVRGDVLDLDVVLTFRSVPGPHKVAKRNAAARAGERKTKKRRDSDPEKTKQDEESRGAGGVEPEGHKDGALPA